MRARSIGGGVERVLDHLAAIGPARTAIAIAILQFSIVSVVGAVAVSVGHREPFAGDWENLAFVGTDPVSQLIAPMERWDALWYQHIARAGYGNDGSTAFFPLYPALGALASNLFLGNVAIGLVAVAVVSYAVGLWLLARLVAFESEPSEPGARSEPDDERPESDDERRLPIVAMLCLATFPTAFFFVAGFTESLFLAVAVASLLFARQGRIGLAALCAMVAALVRIQGVFLILPILWEALRHHGLTTLPWRRPDGPKLVRGLVLAAVAAAAPGVVLVAWYAFLLFMFGPKAVGFSAQAPWGQKLVLPWDAIVSGVQFIQAQLPQPFALIEALNLACLLGFAAFAIVGPRLPVSFLLYEGPSLALVSVRAMFMLPLMSVSRYVLVLVPAFVAAARVLVRRPGWLLAWLGIGIVAQLLLVQWFARWGFVA